MNSEALLHTAFGPDMFEAYLSASSLISRVTRLSGGGKGRVGSSKGAGVCRCSGGGQMKGSEVPLIIPKRCKMHTQGIVHVRVPYECACCKAEAQNWRRALQVSQSSCPKAGDGKRSLAAYTRNACAKAIGGRLCFCAVANNTNSHTYGKQTVPTSRTN